jgi:chromosome segregation ATPase
MADTNLPTQTLRDRLAGLLADWGTEFSCLLDELDEAQGQIAALRAQLGERDSELEGVRGELGERDRQAEESHQQIQALRAELEAAEHRKADASLRDAELARYRRQKTQAEEQVAQLLDELRDLRRSADEEASNQASEEAAELEALRAELDARKTLIGSLRADAGRVSVLEARLKQKIEVIAELEESVNRHAGTIAELKRSAEQWKSRYRALQGDHGATTTTVAAQRAALRQATVVEQAAIAATDEDFGDRTIAIDMRQALVEARRAASGRVRDKD